MRGMEGELIDFCARSRSRAERWRDAPAGRARREHAQELGCERELAGMGELLAGTPARGASSRIWRAAPATSTRSSRELVEASRALDRPVPDPRARSAGLSSPWLMSPPEFSVVCKKLRLRGEPVRDRVPVLRHPPAKARAEARAPRRRADRARGPAGAAPAPGRRARAPAASATALRRRRGPGSTIAALAIPALAPDRRAGRRPHADGPRARSSAPSATSGGATSAAPFVYDDLGYLFVIGLALAIFLPAVERRLGTIPIGAAGRRLRLARDAAADALEDALGDGIPVAAGGNGIALGVLGAWIVLRDARPPRATRPRTTTRSRSRSAPAVLLLLPLVEDFASPWAGLAGGARRRWPAASPPPSAVRPGGDDARRGEQVHRRSTTTCTRYMVDHGARQDEVLRGSRRRPRRWARSR